MKGRSAKPLLRDPSPQKLGFSMHNIERRELMKAAAPAGSLCQLAVPRACSPRTGRAHKKRLPLPLQAGPIDGCSIF
jgi:hypothetical protein